MEAGVQMDVRQVLTLLEREGFCGRTHSGHPIQLFVRASSEQEAWMNIRYRVELSQTERDELKGLLKRRPARGAQAQARADFAGCGCRRQ
jgi:hypothetical protein